MRLYGSEKQVLRGAICPRDSAIGTRCSNASIAGANGAFGSGCWRFWAETRTWSTCCSTPQSSGRINMRPAQKGGAQRSTRPFSRRLEHENTCCGERPRQAGPLFTDRRRASRYGGSRNTVGKPFSQIRHWRQGLRQRSLAKEDSSLRREADHSCEQRNPSPAVRPNKIQTPKHC